MTKSGKIRIGIGGWTFEPWRGVFYPDDLKQKDELAYASRHLTAIEINGTYYGSQKPETWAKWKAETPDGFIFTVKGSRFTTNKKVLAEAGESLAKFLGQGLTELGDRMGPILWQFAPTKKFDPVDFGAFLDLLPHIYEGHPLRHCVEVRNDSFVTPEFPALLRKHNIAVVYADHGTYPAIADVTADFVYARLQTGSDECPTAYNAKDLDAWAKRLNAWAEGGQPDDLPLADPGHTPAKTARDVFCFIIHEGKVRAPAGAQALIERVKVKAALLLALALAVLQAPQDPPAPPPKPKPPVSAPPPVTDGLALCVQACSRTYYFCLQQNEEEICSPSWATCRANCARANP